MRGDFSPGDRLPDRRTLVRAFNVSPVTVQAAMRRLQDQGFLAVGPRKKGTVVAPRPPHLYHYKLLFPYQPDTRGELWCAMRREAERMAGRTERNFSFFYGLGGHRDIQSYQELVDEVRAELIAGLIFASGAAEFGGTPVLDQPGIPRAALASRGELPGVPKLHIDYDSFFTKAIDCLLANGRRRLAVLFGSSPNDETSPVIQSWERAMAARGLRANPVWTQFADSWSPRAARQCLRLLLHLPKPDRPDGLILADDNFLDAAMAGIRDARASIANELMVVALANFPLATPAAGKAIRLGFDVRSVLEALVNRIDAQRAGKRTSELTRVKAHFEEE